jgi:tRNA (adenine37-N6)-methyltransferase
MTEPKAFQIVPIGCIRRDAQHIYVEIDPAFRPALHALGAFSHVNVFWWAARFDQPQDRQNLQTRPPYAESHLCGVFATRSPYRPNPIALTTCKILGVDEDQGLLEIGNIDAFEGTPVLDLKAYFPVCDRVEGASIPAWLVGWPEAMPAEGIGLQEWEQ